jgi:hypothetical protein
MLTENEIINLFLIKLGEEPDSTQLEVYKLCSHEELEKILNRRIAIEQDSTYSQRISENYLKFLEATVEEQQNWKFVEPNL